MNEPSVEIVDIVEPVQAITAGVQGSLWIVFVLVGVSCVLAAVFWWLKNQARLRSLWRLRKLQNDFNSGQMTAHTLAYRIAAELRRRFQIHRLQATCPLSVGNEQQRDDWRSFIAQLDRLRYQPVSEFDSAQAAALLCAAMVWAICEWRSP